MNFMITGHDIAARPAGYSGELHKESEGETGEAEGEEGGSHEVKGDNK